MATCHGAVRRSVGIGAVLASLIVGSGGACGRAVEQVEPTVAAPSAAEQPTVAVVRVVDGAPPDASEVVDWALDRYEQAGLRLPDRIVATFDTSGTACDGVAGLCRPAEEVPHVIVCEPDGTSAFRVMNRQITLLHELAHIWHWTRADGWSDESSIVGGVTDDAVDWHDREAERVAVLVSWGLLETKRRPVRTDLECAELYVRFERLTGRAPLGELEAICLPPGVSALAATKHS